MPETEKIKKIYKLLNKDEQGRFWAKAEVKSEDDCWIWKACIVGGYGATSRGKAHRVALQIKLERQLGLDMFACHKCDNPLCVNPKHLFEGTYRQNMDDMVAKKRQMHGEKRSLITPQRKLSKEEVLEIKKLASARSIKQREIAKMFGVCQGTIGHIHRGRWWKHLKETVS